MKLFLLTLLVACTIGVTQAQNKNTADKIADSYINLKNALVGSNAELAKTRAKELLSTLSAPINGLQPKQQDLVAAYLAKLKFDSRHISETTLIAHQREHFASLSVNMYKLLSGLKLNSTTVYEQYCPMKKAYWLSETEEIRNPYFGDDMLECGKVTATLNAVR